MTEFLPITLTQPLDRQRYSHEFKRQIVEASLTPGTSIAAVAQIHGINANLLHKWCWRCRNGELGAVTAPSALTAVQMVKPARLAVANQHQPTTIRTETTPSSFSVVSNALLLKLWHPKANK
jgi:transposase-like protein